MDDPFWDLLKSETGSLDMEVKKEPSNTKTYPDLELKSMSMSTSVEPVALVVMGDLSHTITLELFS